VHDRQEPTSRYSTDRAYGNVARKEGPGDRRKRANQHTAFYADIDDADSLIINCTYAGQH
jgi:hypothetical protein